MLISDFYTVFVLLTLKLRTGTSLGSITINKSQIGNLVYNSTKRKLLLLFICLFIKKYCHTIFIVFETKYLFYKFI